MKKTLMAAGLAGLVALAVLAQQPVVWQALRNPILMTPLNANGLMITNVADIRGVNGVSLLGGGGGASLWSYGPGGFIAPNGTVGASGGWVNNGAFIAPQ